MNEQIEPILMMQQQLSKLPGIGNKTAHRLAYYLAALPKEQVYEISTALWEGRKKIRYCTLCGNYTVADPCSICSDLSRHTGVLCVVKEPRDVAAIERMHEYSGLYHVLHGTISPIEGIGPDDIRIHELEIRIEKESIIEVILATNPDIDGEATANYIARLIKSKGILVTRLAHGLPVGGDLEYADEVTLSKALSGRRTL